MTVIYDVRTGHITNSVITPAVTQFSNFSPNFWQGWVSLKSEDWVNGKAISVTVGGVTTWLKTVEKKNRNWDITYHENTIVQTDPSQPSSRSYFKVKSGIYEPFVGLWRKCLITRQSCWKFPFSCGMNIDFSGVNIITISITTGASSDKQDLTHNTWISFDD